MFKVFATLAVIHSKCRVEAEPIRSFFRWSHATSTLEWEYVGILEAVSDQVGVATSPRRVEHLVNDDEVRKWGSVRGVAATREFVQWLRRSSKLTGAGRTKSSGRSGLIAFCRALSSTVGSARLRRPVVHEATLRWTFARSWKRNRGGSCRHSVAECSLGGNSYRHRAAYGRVGSDWLRPWLLQP